MLRRTALKRGKPLKRTGQLARGGCTLRAKKPMRRKRARARRGPIKDPAHLAFVRALPCSSCGRKPPSEPQHDTAHRGLGQKAHDRRTHPICRRCHDDFHSGHGRFSGWTKLQRREWQEEQIAAVLAIAPAPTEA